MGNKVDGPSTLSRQSVASVFKVGEKAVQQAKALLLEAPNLAEQVQACTLSLAAVWEQLQGRRREAKANSQRPPRRRSTAQ
jgi:hypothetical protein